MKNYPTREAARSAILIAGLQVAQAKGYQAVTLKEVAERCGRTTMWACNIMQVSALQDAIMRTACESRNLRVPRGSPHSTPPRLRCRKTCGEQPGRRWYE